jgi:hypothetical protein
MNAKILFCGLGLVGLIAGCATQRYAVAPVFPDGSRMPLPEVRRPPTPAEILATAAAQPLAPPEAGGWRELFDGKSLAGWRVTEFEQGGAVLVTNGLLVLERGKPFVGVNGTHALPRINYELVLEAMRVAGEDFFCGLTFPVRESHCSLIVGGWGGGIVGLSNVDGADAAENETTKYVSFETGRWYRIRLRVTEAKIEAWIEQKQVVDLGIVGRQLDVRFGEIMLSRPFGLSAWDTSAAFRGIRVREIGAAELPAR